MKYYFIVIQSFIIICFQSKIGFSAEEGMPQLNPRFWTAQIFWLIITFSFLYICIWKIVLPRTVKNIENRKSIIMHDLHDAEKFKEETEKKLNEYKKIIEDGKNESKKIILNNKKSLEKDLNEKKQKFEIEMEKEIKDVEREIENFQSTSLDKINNIAKQIAHSVIIKIIGTEINDSSLTAVVESSAKEIDQKQT